MTGFYDLIDEYLGDADALTDIRLTIRRLWFYDFDGHPLRLWQGQGLLITDDGLEWLGTWDARGGDLHSTPSFQDGRDGSSATYSFSIIVPDLPGEPALETFNQLKAEQWRARGRNITCYLTAIEEGEGMRPQTLYVFFKQVVMLDPKFSESVSSSDGKSLSRTYKLSVTAKDDGIGRAIRPNGTYTDTCQKRRAAEQGVTLDRGCEFVGALANRTYTLP